MLKENDIEDELSKINLFDLESDVSSVCDECCRPLAIYGFNQRLMCGENNEFIYNEFCDDHAEEFAVEKITYPKKSKIEYESIINTEPNKSGGRARIRRMQTTVYEVLKSLASGMTESDIFKKFPRLTRKDILACLDFAAEREKGFQ